MGRGLEHVEEETSTMQGGLDMCDLWKGGGGWGARDMWGSGHVGREHVGREIMTCGAGVCGEWELGTCGEGDTEHVVRGLGYLVNGVRSRTNMGLWACV